MTTFTSTPPQARPRSKSRASRAADKLAGDRPNLTVVPDPEPAPAPAPAPLPDPLAKLTAALGTGQGLPDSVTQRAAEGATGRSASGENTNPDGTKKGTPQAKANAAAARLLRDAEAKAGIPARTGGQKRPAAKAPKVAGRAPDATVTFTRVNRYVGTVIMPVADGDPVVHVCPHEDRNGHISQDAALSCAGKLARNYAGGTAGTRPRQEPRYWGSYQASAEGSEPVRCSCSFGHRTQESATECARRHAHAAGLLTG